jgi:hypothetical protein
VNPVNDQDGGQPGGNIRVVFFYRTDVPGLSLAPGNAGGPTDANAVVGSGDDTSLLYNPGRVDPTSSAWDASRKPLAGEFLFNGRKLFVIANHFVSKLGDDPMWGQHQPPVNSSETQRHEQANEVASFVSSLLGADPNANVVVLGDLNDFQFSQTVSILESAGLHDLVKDLPVPEQYTYVFDGNSQAIDHILVGGGLSSADRDYDAVHVNSEFVQQVSDHDPQVASFGLAPTVQFVCGLTVQYLETSPKFQRLPPPAQRAADALAQAACKKLDRLPGNPAARRAAINAYVASVNALARAGWLTQAQADDLTGLARAL